MFSLSLPVFPTRIAERKSFCSGRPAGSLARSRIQKTGSKKCQPNHGRRVTDNVSLWLGQTTIVEIAKSRDFNGYRFATVTL
jgi:hypothetical protein